MKQMQSAWADRTVEELCKVVTSGGTPSRSNPDFYLRGTIPWVKTGDLRDGYVTEYDEYITEAAVAKSSAKLLPTETILMAMYGATVGMLGILSEPAACNQAACAMVANPELADPRWLFYALRNDRDRIVSRANGAAQQNLSGTTIKGLAFPTPGLPEQRAIAEVLGALDDKVAGNSKLAATASALAGLVYDRAVASSPIRTLSHVLTPILGGTPSRSDSDFWSGSNLWASAKDVTGASAGVVVDTEEKISDLAILATKAKPLPAGSVIMTARGTVGAVARLAKPSSFNQSCYGFAPGALPAGVLYFSIVRATERAKAIAHGSVFDTITMKTFDHLSLPEINSAKVSELEALLVPLLDTVTSAVTQTASLVATRDALLPQLISGRLRVKDAEEVLERVL